MKNISANSTQVNKRIIYLKNHAKPQRCVNGFFAGLCSGGHVALIGSRLYLPKEWTSDNGRSSKAGIREEYMQYQSKPELAIAIYRNLPLLEN